ncbi:unnamed protein product, partial [Allacma fusca]
KTRKTLSKGKAMTKAHNDEGIENFPGSDNNVNTDENEFQFTGRCSYGLSPSEIKILGDGDLHVKIVNCNSQEIKPEEIVVAIDGGWGWIVVLGSFFSNFIVDGIVFSFGLKVEAIHESFKETGQDTIGLTEIGWIMSLLHAFYGIGGPLGAALSNRFGFRIVGIIGSITASLGLGITYLVCRTSPNLYALLIINSIIGGTGVSLMYVPSVIAVGFYFEKHRALATGISICGSGLGQTVFGTLEYYFLSNYGWKLSLVIDAGLYLCVCFSAALYRPLRPRKVVTQAPPDACGQGDNGGTEEVNLIRRISTKSARSLLAYTSTTCKTRGKLMRRIWRDWLQELEIRSFLDIQTINSPLFRDDILYSGSMHRIPGYAETVGSGILSSNEWCVIVANDGAPVSAGKNKKSKHRGKLLKSFRKLFNVEILTSYSFILIAFSNVLTSLVFIVPYAYLPIIAEQNNQRKADTAVFFTVMGASSTASRIICGVIADLPKVKPAILLAGALTIGGISTVLIPFCTNYWLFIAYAVAFGMSGE